MDVLPIFKKIIKDNSTEDIHQEVQDLKLEFISDDWADEFDDVDEAYEEQGRNEAENITLNSLINAGVHGYPMMNADHNKLFDMLAKHYELQSG
ncbi:MAG: hypothetical protein GY797_17440 [Deltaproteobacteria bacterium]|nr:hypothetical protein [Deltaproteobacteria bacterium]